MQMNVLESRLRIGLIPYGYRNAADSYADGACWRRDRIDIGSPPIVMKICVWALPVYM